MHNLPSPEIVFELLKNFEEKVKAISRYTDQEIEMAFYHLMKGCACHKEAISYTRRLLGQYRPAVVEMISFELSCYLETEMKSA